MLKSVLKKEDCAACRFCCSFRRQSLWELPKLPLWFVKEHKRGFTGEEIRYIVCESDKGKWAVTDLTDKYMTDDPEEDVPCPFLDPDNGCILSDEDKPFECGAWPLRLMKMSDGCNRVCMSDGCPAIKKTGEDVLRDKVAKGWKKEMTDHAQKEPYIVGKYQEGYTLLE